MKPFFRCGALALLSACAAPVEAVQPFIFITLDNPDGLVAPVVDSLRMTNESIVDGEVIFKEFDLDVEGLLLPTTLAIQFSEGIRGNIVDIEVQGLLAGELVWFSQASAVADATSIEMIARFCGDGLDDDVLGEECDDGALNSDIEPDACRTSCQDAFCGDAVPDAGEECDDGNLVEGDGCDSNCTLSQCSNGILAPGEFCLTQQAPVTVGLGPVDLELGDIDNDGSLDIVVANANNNTISILRSLGGGQFDLSTESGFTARVVELADLNNDDRLDIISGGDSGSTNAFTILRQLQGGTFAKQTITTTACTDNKAIISGDFNLDGFPEVVLGCRGVGLQVFENSSSTGGAISFSGQEILPLGSTDDPAVLLVDNFNQDAGGVLDIAALNLSFSPTRLGVFLGTNGGTFVSEESTTIVNNAVFPNIFQTDWLASADLNGDNLPEVLVVNKFGNGLGLLVNQGGGQFNAPILFPSLGFTPSAVSLFDVTGDGLEDILFTGNNQLHILPGLGGTNFGDALVFATGAGSQSIGVGDVNGDGLLDVVTADHSANALSIFLQDP